MIWFLNKKSQTMTPYFSLFILTRLCVWLLCLDFPYKALDTLISADGLVRWTDLKNVRPIITWSPPASHELKWIFNYWGVLRYRKGVVQYMFSLSVGLKESNKVNCLQWWKLWSYHLPERSFRGRELVMNRILPKWLIGCRVSWIDHCLFKFASRFSSALVSVKSSHVPREGNFMADALAKQGVKRICELVAWWLGSDILFSPGYLNLSVIFMGTWCLWLLLQGLEFDFIKIPFHKPISPD